MKKQLLILFGIFGTLLLLDTILTSYTLNNGFLEMNNFANNLFILLGTFGIFLKGIITLCFVFLFYLFFKKYFHHYSNAISYFCILLLNSVYVFVNISNIRWLLLL